MNSIRKINKQEKLSKENLDSVVETLLKNCESYQNNLKFSRALASGLSVAELKKIERRTIVEYKKGREFNALKEMWQARGKNQLFDELFDKLSDIEKHDIIYIDIKQLGKFSLLEWWKGMTISEKFEGIISLIKKNNA